LHAHAVGEGEVSCKKKRGNELLYAQEKCEGDSRRECNVMESDGEGGAASMERSQAAVSRWALGTLTTRLARPSMSHDTVTL
jgi:hypothetical protein